MDRAVNQGVVASPAAFARGLDFTPEGEVFSRVIAPDDLLRWGTLLYEGRSPAGTALAVDVVDEGGEVLAADVPHGADVGTLVEDVGRIRLRARLSTDNRAREPRSPGLAAWSLSSYSRAPGIGYLRANWDAFPGVRRYLVRIGTAPGDDSILSDTAVGVALSYEARGLWLERAQSGVVYYVTVSNEVRGDGPQSSNGVAIAELETWDGDVADLPVGTFRDAAGRLVAYGDHFFEEVAVPVGKEVAVAPFDRLDAVGSGALPGAAAVSGPRDGWLAVRANGIDFGGTIDARGQLVEGEVGSVRIWEHPIVGEEYVLGADCAEGVPGGDYSAGAVLRKSTRKQVASNHGHLGEIESDAYGHLLEYLGYHYNTALIAPEINAYGRAVVEYLLKRMYPKLYHRPSQGKEEVDYSNQVGWQTTSATKPVMISDLAAAIRDESIDIPERETVEELLGYLVLDNGKTGNDPEDANSHDDRVMRLAIAIQALNYVDAPPIKNWDDRRHIRKVVR